MKGKLPIAASEGILLALAEKQAGETVKFFIVTEKGKCKTHKDSKGFVMTMQSLPHEKGRSFVFTCSHCSKEFEQPYLNLQNLQEHGRRNHQIIYQDVPIKFMQQASLGRFFKPKNSKKKVGSGQESLQSAPQIEVQPSMERIKRRKVSEGVETSDENLVPRGFTSLPDTSSTEIWKCAQISGSEYHVHPTNYPWGSGDPTWVVNVQGQNLTISASTCGARRSNNASRCDDCEDLIRSDAFKTLVKRATEVRGNLSGRNFAYMGHDQLATRSRNLKKSSDLGRLYKLSYNRVRGRMSNQPISPSLFKENSSEKHCTGKIPCYVCRALVNTSDMVHHMSCHLLNHVESTNAREALCGLCGGAWTHASGGGKKERCYATIKTHDPKTWKATAHCVRLHINYEPNFASALKSSGKSPSTNVIVPCNWCESEKNNDKSLNYSSCLVWKYSLPAHCRHVHEKTLDKDIPCCILTKRRDKTNMTFTPGLDPGEKETLRKFWNAKNAATDPVQILSAQDTEQTA